MEILPSFLCVQGTTTITRPKCSEHRKRVVVVNMLTLKMGFMYWLNFNIAAARPTCFI